VPASDPSALDAGVWVSTAARPIRDVSGQIIAAVATLRDITEQRAAAERLRDLSSTDELTGLLNRRGFLAHANARVATLRRTKATLALLFADVNGLKRINDELGHEQGDQVIKDAAAVLRTVFREGDVLARLGGDEFVALLPNFSHAAREPLVERLATAIRAHIEREPRPFRLSISAGVTFMDWESGQSLDELLAAADQAMYTRKRERAGQSMPVLRAVPSPSRNRGS
jgi:diguanylate cyclase (GGDEF)-like protein